MKDKEGFFSKLFSGLTKTRNTITSRIEQVLKFSSAIDDELFEELEEILITSDIGVKSTSKIIDTLKDKIKERKIKDPSQVRDVLKEILRNILGDNESGPGELKLPAVIMVVGVNGVGKTTSIGKLSKKYKDDGLKVLMAAADTFRAAAIDQL
jgi:fused signal recognition particle receptor